MRKSPGAVNARYGHECETLLHTAAEIGREDLVPTLLEHGADLRITDRLRRTALDTAAAAGRVNIVALLLAKGANANASGFEEPPLFYAVTIVPGPTTAAARLEVTRLLVTAGADVNARGPDGRTPLLRALGPGSRGGEHGPLVEFLLTSGADVRVRDGQGVSALEYAADSANRNVVQLLLDWEADRISPPADAPALGGALSTAAYRGSVDIAALLIDRGADPNSRYVGPLPLDWERLPLATALVVAPSADKAVAAQRRDVARLLVDRGADVRARDKSGATLLHAVAATGDLEAMELLLSHGADVNAADRAGFTPLHRAVQNGHVAAAVRLMASGADPQAAAADGTTVLALAANDGAMEALLRSHADK